MTLSDDMKMENEMLRMRLADSLFRSRNDTSLIKGMHNIIIKCGTGTGMKTIDVIREFQELKIDVFGDTDE